MLSQAAVRDKRLEMGSFVLMEAGPEMRGPSPARRRAFPLWKVRMKRWLFAGIVVAALGAFVLTRGISYPSHRSAMRVGGFEASVQEQRAIPRWVGVVAVAGGALMIGAGLRGRKA